MAEVEVQVQKLSPKAIKVAEGLMEKLTEVERRYMEDFMLGLSARQSAVKREVKTHTVYVARSALRRKLEILMIRSEIYIRLPKPPAVSRWVKTSALAKRMGISIDTLQWWVKREEKREGGPSLPLPVKVNNRYRWTVGQAEMWIRYAESQKAARSTADVAALLDWPVSRLHTILEKQRELYALRYDEWHVGEVVRLVDALECAGSLTSDEAQAAKAKLEERKDGKA